MPGGSQTAARGRRASRPAFLPAELSAFLKRRLSEFVGVVLVLLGGLVGLALVSYHPGDPSWNVAAESGEIRNLLGRLGSYPADLLIQTIGAGAFAFALVPVIWGWRSVQHRPLRRSGVRVLALLCLAVLAAISLASWPAPAAWSGHSSLGGALGRVLYEQLGEAAMLAGGPVWYGWVVIGAASLAFVTLLVALGLSWREWRSLMATTRRIVAAGLRGAAIGARRAGSAVLQAIVFAYTCIRGAIYHWRRRAEIRRKAAASPSPASSVPDTAPAAPDRPQPRTAPPVAPRPKPVPVGVRARDERQAELAFDEHGDHQLPPLDLLHLATESQRPAALDEESLQRNAELLEGVLGDFGVRGEIVRVNPGPVVTLYELEPAPGTKSSRVIGLADDIARSMSAVSVRVAVVPGRNAIGIELPNAKREIVYLRELLAAKTYERSSGKLTLVLGKDIGGTPVIADLARMPHLLVAGTTGSGKSVAINTMILSLLYRLPPERVRFILVDPKMLELSVYDGIPHLLSPVVTDPKQAVVALKWTVREMEDRYRAMSKLGVRNVEGYNQRLRDARQRGEVLMRRVQTGFDPDTGKPVFEDQPLDLTELPYIVVVVDEMADLMMVAGKDIEAAIQRLAQMARAAGIHLIMATQRPSVDVITGTIKANFPTRISFQVTSKIDSRTILGESGAEQLLGQGDMLYMAGGGRVTRVHGPFVSDGEVEEVVRFLKTQGEPDYNDAVLEDDEGIADMLAAGLGAGRGESGDELYDQAVALVARERKASTSFIQRHLQIGYNRAARIIERMESEGVVGKANHVGKREVLVGDHSE